MKKITITIFLCFIAAIAFSQDAKFEKGLKAFDSKDYMKALKVMKPFAESGDPKAQFIVGFCYYKKELEIKNDSIAEYYLLKSSEQKFGRAMGLLSVLYWENSLSDSKYRIDALVWAEIAAAYDSTQKGTNIRYVIKAYMSSAELEKVEQLLQEKIKIFNKINLEDTTIPQKNSTESYKTVIPENQLGLMEDPYRDWVLRWKYERFECDTFFYTMSIDSSIIKSTISKIESSEEFKLWSLYRGNQTENLKLSPEEKEFLKRELYKLLNHEWEENIFPFSSRLDSPKEIQNTLNMTEKFETEKEMYTCSVVYTFSKPIFIRDSTLVLFLDQKSYGTDYTKVSFSFYSLVKDNWRKSAIVYEYLERKNN